MKYKNTNIIKGMYDENYQKISQFPTTTMQTWKFNNEKSKTIKKMFKNPKIQPEQCKQHLQGIMREKIKKILQKSGGCGCAHT